MQITGAALADPGFQPACAVEGDPNWNFEYDVTFDTDANGGGVFGSNLWKLRVSVHFNLK